MVFSSIPFLYYFLPVFLVLYFAVPGSWRNFILVLASLFFYGFEEPVYILLMLGSILAGYAAGLGIGLSVSPVRRRFFLLAGIFLHTGVLLYFKYTDFFLLTCNSITGSSIPLKHIVLPLGISFYTFQILSYLLDVYYRRIDVQKNFICFAAYVSMFPQLVAGPIVRYQDIAGTLKTGKITAGDLQYGIQRFLNGLTKKIILADNLGKLVHICQTCTESSVLFAWIYAISYTLQIYYDFSGYSDMAIGLGRILGFSFPENFDHPYESRSITEFWRRWHITLGRWFRDYIYIPLGGSHCSRPFFIRNLLLVWALTGLWHGAAWNFVLWGLYYAVLLLLEKLLWTRFRWKDSLPRKILSHTYVLLVTVIGFVLFNSATLREAAETVAAMSGLQGLPLISREAVYYLASYAVIILLAVLFATSLPMHLLNSLKKRGRQLYLTGQRWLYPAFITIKCILYIMLLLICTAYLVDENFHPFLYFRF